MNAAFVTASDSLVNLATGAIIDPTNAAGVLVQSHSPGTACANKAFDYMSEIRQSIPRSGRKSLHT
jgi:hypothetical protein